MAALHGPTSAGKVQTSAEPIVGEISRSKLGRNFHRRPISTESLDLDWFTLHWAFSITFLFRIEVVVVAPTAAVGKPLALHCLPVEVPSRKGAFAVPNDRLQSALV